MINEGKDILELIDDSSKLKEKGILPLDAFLQLNGQPFPRNMPILETIEEDSEEYSYSP